MAIGPEIARNPPSTWEETLQKQRKTEALQHIEAIAKAAEEALDARISTGQSLNASDIDRILVD